MQILTGVKSKTHTSQVVLTTLTFTLLTAVALGFFVSIFSYYSLAGLTVKVAAVSNTNLIGYWNFNESSGNTALDLTRGKNGTIYYNGQMNASRLTNGIKGSALNFASYRSYVNMGNNFSDINKNQITVSYWVRLNQLPNNLKNEVGQPVKYPNLISKTNSYYHYFGTEAGWGIGTANKNKLIIKWIDANDGSHDGSNGNISSMAFVTNTWYHIAWVFDGTTAKLYINGNLDNTTSVSLPIKSLISQLTFSSFANSFDGSMDEIKIYSTALSAAKVNSIYQSNSCGSLDPFSVECIYYCNDKNDANDQEKLGCMKNSCNNKYGSDSDLAIACADIRRVSFNVFEAMYKVYTYCQEPGIPNSEDCLMATSYKLETRDNLLKSSCDYKNKTNPTNSYSCFQTAKYGTYNIINTLVNCSDLSNPDNINECTYYLGHSTPDNTLYDQRAQDICNIFNNCSTTVGQAKQNYGYASETEAKAQAASSDLSSILEELKKKYVDGYCLDPTFMDPCGPRVSHGRYNFLRVGQLGNCHAICNSEMLGQACSNLFAGEKPNRRLLNEYAQSLVENCSDFSWPKSAGKCAAACLCAHAQEACDDKPGCDSNTHEACHICYPLVPVAVNDGSGMSEITVNGTTITGTSSFLTNLVAMFNKIAPDSRNGCNILPPGCVFSRSYDAADPAGSAHKSGVALDICCSGTPNSSCGLQNVSDMISKISGFNTIRECTPGEKTCNGTTNCSGGLVHIDSKSHGSGQPTSGCNYKNCDWSSSNCH